MASFLLFVNDDDTFHKCVLKISRYSKRIDIVIGEDTDDGAEQSAVQFTSLQAMKNFRDYLTQVIMEEE